MKKEYMKPTMRVVKIQHSGIICTSLTTTSTNLDKGETLTIDDDTPAGDGFWGR